MRIRDFFQPFRWFWNFLMSFLYDNYNQNIQDLKNKHSETKFNETYRIFERIAEQNDFDAMHFATKQYYRFLGELFFDQSIREHNF